MPTRTLVLLLSFLALVAAGCGGDDGGGSSEGSSEALSKEDYIEEINSAQTTFVDAASNLNLASPESPKAFADSIEELNGSVDQLVTDLEEITPPEEIADLHQQLIDGMEEYGSTISENVEGLRSGDQQKLVQAAQNIGEASTEFSTSFTDQVSKINEQLGAG